MPRAVSLVDPSGLGHVAAEVALQLGTVQTQVGRFAHADVLPRRSFFKGELPGPQVRLGIGVKVKTLRLDLIDGVRRRGFNPVHLLRQQRRGTGVGLRQGDQHHFIHPGNAIFVPVVGVFIEDQLLTRHQLLQFERAATHRVGGEGGPRLFAARGAISHAGRHRVILLLPRRRRDDKQVGDVVRQQRIRFRGGQRHGVVVNFLCAGEGRHARQGVADLTRGVLRRRFIQHLIHVPDDGVGVHLRPIMKLHPRTQGENPAAGVLRIDVPLGRQPRHQTAGLFTLRQIPLHQRVVQRDAGKAVALIALIRLAKG